MICPRCGWVMRLLNIREHGKYSDELYQCKCGTTHLHIVPRNSVLSTEDLVNFQPDLQPTENR